MGVLAVLLILSGASTLSLNTTSSMAKTTNYLQNFLRWRSGRQETGYEKMLLLVNPLIVPFDCYLLRFKKGAGIPPHTDPVSSKRHYRLNIVLRHADEGGEFECRNAIYNGRRIKLFRPDQSRHSVSPIVNGVRYVLSIGWVLKGE